MEWFLGLFLVKTAVGSVQLHSSFKNLIPSEVWYNVILLVAVVFFTEQQLLWLLPDRDTFVERRRQSERIEPWFEDTHLPFDVVADWVSRSFKAAEGHWDRPLLSVGVSNESCGHDMKSLSEFALDFYFGDDIVISSDSEPGAEELAHWSSVYQEVRFLKTLQVSSLRFGSLIKYPPCLRSTMTIRHLLVA